MPQSPHFGAVPLFFVCRYLSSPPGVLMIRTLFDRVLYLLFSRHVSPNDHTSYDLRATTSPVCTHPFTRRSGELKRTGFVFGIGGVVQPSLRYSWTCVLAETRATSGSSTTLCDVGFKPVEVVEKCGQDFVQLCLFGSLTPPSPVSRALARWQRRAND